MNDLIPWIEFKYAPHALKVELLKGWYKKYTPTEIYGHFGISRSYYYRYLKEMGIATTDFESVNPRPFPVVTTYLIPEPTPLQALIREKLCYPKES